MIQKCEMFMAYDEERLASGKYGFVIVHGIPVFGYKQCLHTYIGLQIIKIYRLMLNNRRILWKTFMFSL